MSDWTKVTRPIPAPNEWCAFDFSPQDKRAIEFVYALAAQDPEFLADNEAVQQDFAALDREMNEVVVWS